MGRTKSFLKIVKKEKKDNILSFYLTQWHYNLIHKTHGQLGELAETTSLLRMRTRKGTLSSNLRLSATNKQHPHHTPTTQ